MEQSKIDTLLEYLNSDDNEWGNDGDEDTLSIIVTEDNIKVINDYEIATPQGTFLILTDEEAREREAENLEQLIDENHGDISFFRPYDDYVKDNFIKDTDSMREYMHNDYESYFEDIKSESANDSFFENRCQQELYESQVDDEIALENYKGYVEDLEDFRDLDNLETIADILRNRLENNGNIAIDDNGKFIVDDVNFVEICNWLNDDNRDMSGETLEKMQNLYFDEEYSGCEDDIEKLKDWFLNYEDNESDLIEKAIDKIILEYDGGYDWLKFNFGEDEVKYHIENGNLEFDYDGMAEFFINELGIGSELNYYDGKCDEYNGFNIMKIDDDPYIKEKDKSKAKDNKEIKE